MSDELLVRIPGIVSKSVRQKLDELTMRKKMPVSLLVAIAIEHEFERERPFEYDVTLPDDEYVDFAYADEAGKILDYMKMSAGLALETIILIRDDIGVPDKKTFLLALRECIIKGFLVPYKPRQPEYAKFKYDDDKVFYRFKDADKAVVKKIRKEASEYSKFKRLEKKYKGK